MFTSLLAPRLRPLWAGILLLALVIAAINFPPTRAWASSLLGLFRVKQITVLPVDTTRLSELTDNQALGNRIAHLFSDSITTLREPGPPQTVADAATAEQLAGYHVRLWAASPRPPQITVQGRTTFAFTIDRDRAQSVIADFGRADLQLPANLDGATITVDIPPVVTAAYGDCPPPQTPKPPINDTGTVAPHQPIATSGHSCTLLVQAPSPTVVTPPDIDLLPVIEIGLQLSGMSAAEAHAYSTKVDWTSTLIIPLPMYQADYREVSVDGANGLLFTVADANTHTLLWVKDEVIYAIGTTEGAVAYSLEIANALR